MGVANVVILIAVSLYLFGACAIRRVQPRPAPRDWSRDVVAFQRPSIYCIDLGKIRVDSEVHIYRCPVSEIKGRSNGAPRPSCAGSAPRRPVFGLGLAVHAHSLATP